jgi:hypothetical protein
MPTDLSTQIRALIDVADPVSPQEAMARTGPTLSTIDVPPSPATWRRPVLVAAGVVILAGAVTAGSLEAFSPATHPRRTAAKAPHRTVILTAAQVHTIVTSSTAAAHSSGTAQVTKVDAQGSTPQSNSTVAVTFDGANIDEQIAVQPEPPGSGHGFSTDDRLVNGQFYIYTAGPNDVDEWMHDTDSANDVASMQFPDPRTLYAALSSGAQFEVVGTEHADGTTLTRLQAADPSAINPAPLGNLVQGTVSSFSMTVDQNDVVRQMSFESTQTVQICHFTSGPLKSVQVMPGAHLHGPLASTTPTDCGATSMSSTVTVAFSHLGEPESVAVPAGAVNFAGKG